MRKVHDTRLGYSIAGSCCAYTRIAQYVQGAGTLTSLLRQSHTAHATWRVTDSIKAQRVHVLPHKQTEEHPLIREHVLYFWLWDNTVSSLGCGNKKDRASCRQGC